MSGVDFYIDTAGEHRFRIEGNNGEIVAQSEGYVEFRDAEHGAEVVATQGLRWLVQRRGVEAAHELVAAAWRDLVPTSMVWDGERFQPVLGYVEADTGAAAVEEGTNQ